MTTKKYHFFLTFLTLILFSCKEDIETVIPPEACFEFPTTQAKAGDVINLTNCSLNAPLFAWDFGDGETSTQTNPSHTYRQHGDYDIVLLAGEDINLDGILNQDDSPSAITKSISIDPTIKSIELTIKDASSWTEQNPTLLVVSGANANLFISQSSFDSGIPDFVVASGDDGIIKFYDLQDGSYFLTVDKGDLKSSKNGLLINGVYQSQDDIDASAFQENATIGGIKYVDLNGDGLIDTQDDADYRTIVIPDDVTYTKEIVIGN